MKVIVQRSLNGKCTVEGKITGQINKGLMLLVGFTEGDNLETIQFLVNKILHLRIFNDENGIMNKNILEVQETSILSISQFTLYADTQKGNRPSYIKALNGQQAEVLYNVFNQELSKEIHVETGIFGTDMKIDFVNDGPVTIILER